MIIDMLTYETYTSNY